MANFCKQCSIEIFQEDFADLAGFSVNRQELISVLCEGCGNAVVDNTGECVNRDCLKKHGVPNDSLS